MDMYLSVHWQQESMLYHVRMDKDHIDKNAVHRVFHEQGHQLSFDFYNKQLSQLTKHDYIIPLDIHSIDASHYNSLG